MLAVLARPLTKLAASFFSSWTKAPILRAVFAFTFLAGLICIPAFQNWQARDWLMWPLDNVLRLLDLAGAMQVFGWKLHGVEDTFFNQSWAILFRFAVGLVVLGWINVLLLRLMGGLGFSREDLLLEIIRGRDADAAIKVLAQSGDGFQFGILHAMLPRLKTPESRCAVLRGMVEFLEGALRVPSRVTKKTDASRIARETDPLTRAFVCDLIDSLADNSELVRDEATRCLVVLGPLIVPTLNKVAEGQECDPTIHDLSFSVPGEFFSLPIEEEPLYPESEQEFQRRLRVGAVAALRQIEPTASQYPSG